MTFEVRKAGLFSILYFLSGYFEVTGSRVLNFVWTLLNRC